MFGVRTALSHCAMTRFSAVPLVGGGCVKVARSFACRVTPMRQAAESVARPVSLGSGMGASLCARSLGAPTVRAYQSVARTPQTSTSQQLWRLAGVGALAGLGLVALDGLRESAGPNVYPSYVAQRVASTYGYVVAGLGMTAGFAQYILRSGLYYRVASMNPMIMLVGTMAGTIGSMIAVRSIDHKPTQHAAWIMFTGFMGLSLFPIATLGGAIVQRALVGTAAIVGSISLVAATTRSDAHLAMAGPLGVGFGVVFAASIGQLFLPASPLLYNIAVYGGLAVFGGFTFFDTQRMIQKAKFQQVYDPLKTSISIYMDTINIFTRMVAIMSNGNRRK